MSRIINGRNLLLCGLLPKVDVNGIDFDKFKEARGLFIEDPWDRVKSIFSRDDMGVMHPELAYALNMAQVGFFAGSAYGGIIESFKKTDKFLRTNDANIYVNKGELYKALSHENLKGIVKGIFLYGPQFALFLGSFSLISSCCEAFRNKHNILDNTIAGFSVGAVTKFFYGPKGMLSGGIVGGVLGTLYGIFQWTRYKLTKVDDVQIKYAHFAFTRHRELMSKGVLQREAKANPGSDNLPKPDELDSIDDDNKEVKSSQQKENKPVS